jgi:hypothetical protein
MKIDENYSQRKLKTLKVSNDFKIGSPFKKTPSKDVQLVSNINTKIPIVQD